MLPDLQQTGHVILDEPERGHHLGHALPGEVLEVARLENPDHAVADVSG
jgi:hypothetical protein